MIHTVLFDLDGTLADTAPDLAHALNCVLEEQGQTALPFEAIRPIVSHGGTVLLSFGFNLQPDAPQFDTLRDRFLSIYLDNIAVNTRLFPGMESVLKTIEQRGMSWGVVTNKPAWLTNPLMEQLGLADRAVCIISGDTLEQRKPHPAPMLLACKLAGKSASECLYIGDAARDIEAGRNAGMKTLVAMYGYIGTDDKPEQWGADSFVQHPQEIIQWLDQDSTVEQELTAQNKQA